MRDIASLYGGGGGSSSLSGSMVSSSRDPDGINPQDSYTSSVDPPEDRSAAPAGGSISSIDAEEEMTVEQEEQRMSPMSSVATAEQADQEEQQLQQVDNATAKMDIATLVGAPPPPPSLPPPKKAVRRVIKTPRANVMNSGSSNDDDDNGQVAEMEKVDTMTEDVTMMIPPPPQVSANTTTTVATKTPPPTKAQSQPFQELPTGSQVTTGAAGVSSASSSFSTTSRSPKKSTSPGKSLLEERMKKALSTYESEFLVLDEDNEQLLKGAHSMQETPEHSKSPETNNELVMAATEDESALQYFDAGMTTLSPTVRTGHTGSKRAFIQAGLSPSSEVTRPHSNQTNTATNSKQQLQTKQSLPPATLIESPRSSRSSSRQGDVITTTTETATMTMKAEPSRARRRAFSLERKQRRGASPSASGKDKKKTRRGFFKKLFRGSNHDSSSSNSTNSRKDEVEKVVDKVKEPASARTQQMEQQEQLHYEGDVATSYAITVDMEGACQPPSPKADREQKPVQFTPDEKEELSVTASPRVAPEVLINLPTDAFAAEEKVAFNEASSSKPDHMPSDHIETKEGSAEEIFPSLSTSSHGSRKTFSQDPPDDEHGDPPMYTGPPLLSPSARQQSAAVDEYPVSSVDKGSDPFLPVQGEVSIMSGPSFESLRRIISADPSPKQERDGLEDPPLEEHFEPLPTPAHLVQNLRVQVHGASLDPVGASPVVQGKEIAGKSSSFGDPLGESPMAWPKPNSPSNDPNEPSIIENNLPDSDGNKSPTERAMSLLSEEDKIEILNLNTDVPDPPLDNGYLSEDSTSVIGDEKKEDTTDEIGVSTIDGPADKGPSKAKSEPKFGADLRMVTEPVKTPANNSSKRASAYVSLKQLHDDTGRALNVTTDFAEAEKSGFNPTGTSASDSELLTVSAAAFTNAKAVEYFHRLDGEPSPRHSWHVSKVKNEKSAAHLIEATPRTRSSKKSSKKKKNLKPAPKKLTSPSPDEYSATNFVAGDVAKKLELEATTTKDATKLAGDPPRKTQYVPNSRIGSRFQGRKPTLKPLPKPESPVALRPPSPAIDSVVDKKGRFVESLALVVPLGKITGLAVSRGMELRRKKREDDIASGRSDRVVVTPRSMPKGGNRFKMIRDDESEIKDPIKRAGRRLLSKAAVPIQCAARRFLARQEALDRMWAIVQIQSVIRRWRCEVNLQAHIHSATVIQKAYRGWGGREHVKKMHSGAVMIQKIVRGYLAAVRTYDMLYFICQAQALMRGALVRMEHDTKTKAAVDIQKVYRGYHVHKALRGMPHVIGTQTLFRGYQARQQFAVARYAATAIQSMWRSHSARVNFQMTVVDVIVVQSVVRQWSAFRSVTLLRNVVHCVPVTRVQTTWRRHNAMMNYQRHIAARKIQARWRGFQCYTDFIFMIVDVLVVQRIARQWLAKRKVDALRKELAAVVIQRNWRRCIAQKQMVSSLAHIIIVQSVARRYISRFVVQKQIQSVAKIIIAKNRRHEAASCIQKTWRGFWAYSHFIIVQYECTRIQALARGRVARRNFNLTLGCAILIQASMRRCLAKRAVARKFVGIAVALSMAQELRERSAANRIQFWWRIVLDWMKEKKAALTIERFFISVKAEVDRVIVEQQLKVASRERRESIAMKGEDHLLERAWLNTVDENRSTRSNRRSNHPRSKSPAPRHGTPPYPLHRTPQMQVNPRMQATGPKEFSGIVSAASSNSYVAPPPDSVRLAVSEDFSEITNPSVFHRMPKYQSKNSKVDQLDDMFLDETFEEVKQKPLRPKTTKNRPTAEDYIRKYGGGMKTAPNRLSKSGSGGAFFSDGTHTTHTTFASQTQASTPQSASSGKSSRRRHSGGMSISVGPDGPEGSIAQSPRVPPSPRSSASPRKSRRSQSSPRTLPGSRRDSLSHYPPLTPTRQKNQIASRGTIDTESQSMMSGTTYTRSSPMHRGVHGPNNKNPVMIMRTYGDPEDDQSYAAEAHEMLLLGEEYGEV